MTEYHFHFYKYLKNMDLDCLSAHTAIKTMIGYDALTSLKRYLLWDIIMEDSSEENALNKINSITETAYYLSNPNKESHYINTLPSPKITQPEQQTLLLKVSSKTSNSDRSRIQKIYTKTGIKIKSLFPATVWELLVSSSLPENELKATLLKKVILSSSSEDGILAHPLYETADFIPTKSIYQ